MDNVAVAQPTALTAPEDTRFLARLFYGSIGVAASLALTLAFYWNLRLNTSISSLVLNFLGTPWYFWPYVFLTLGTVGLFGVNAALFVYRWRRFGPPRVRGQAPYKSLRLSTGQASTAGGTLVGLAASACPLCGSTLLAAIGIAGGLSAFPLQGLELKTLSLVLMALPVWLLRRDIRVMECDTNACPVPRDASYQEKDRTWMLVLSALVAALLIVGWFMLRSDPIVARVFAADGEKLAHIPGDQCRIVEIRKQE